MIHTNGLGLSENGGTLGTMSAVSSVYECRRGAERVWFWTAAAAKYSNGVRIAGGLCGRKILSVPRGGADPQRRREEHDARYQ